MTSEPPRIVPRRIFIVLSAVCFSGVFAAGVLAMVSSGVAGGRAVIVHHYLLSFAVNWPAFVGWTLIAFAPRPWRLLRRHPVAIGILVVLLPAVEPVFSQAMFAVYGTATIAEVPEAVLTSLGNFFGSTNAGWALLWSSVEHTVAMAVGLRAYALWSRQGWYRPETSPPQRMSPPSIRTLMTASVVFAGLLAGRRVVAAMSAVDGEVVENGGAALGEFFFGFLVSIAMAGVFAGLLTRRWKAAAAWSGSVLAGMGVFLGIMVATLDMTLPPEAYLSFVFGTVLVLAMPATTAGLFQWAAIRLSDAGVSGASDVVRPLSVDDAADA